MSETVFIVATVWVSILLGIMVLRTARAPTTGQRILALDLMTLLLIGLLALAAADDGRSFTLDAALAIALLSFIATLAAARYYENRRPFT